MNIIRVKLFPLFFSLCGLFMVPAVAEAATVSFGATTWYSWWTPPFKKLVTGSDSIAHCGGRFEMKDSTFLYGPSLSVKFDDRWSLGGLFLFCAHKGGFSSESSYLFIRNDVTSTLLTLYYNGLGAQFVPLVAGYGKIGQNKINRYDLDLTVAYSFNNTIKIFGGFKYQGFAYNAVFTGIGGLISRISPLMLGLLPRYTIKTDWNSFGGGLGPSVNARLVENLFFVFSASGFLMGVQYRSVISNNRTTELVFITFGVNANASLAYYAERARLTLSLGYRFQYGKFASSSFATSDRFDNLNMFHGPTFSLIYTF